MKLNIFILSITFLLTNSFAIKDILYKPNYILKKVLYKSSNSNYPANLDFTLSSDDKNLFFINNHFRVIIGKNSSDDIKKIAKNLLSISKNVWEKEIVEYKFKNPRNSNKKLIDIYLANTKAYNKAIYNYITIPSNYSGYATAYFDGTPYFVVNPNVNINIIKVTIAHEFFHTIQYAYGLDIVSNEIWYKNVWFLEASAVMMEDEVYDNVNDYKNYLPAYLEHTRWPLTYTNGAIEYGKVLFAKYLKEKYGIDFFRKLFENYKTDETILTDIQTITKEYNTTFNNLILDFGVCLANIKTCLEEGNMYSTPKYYSIDNNKTIYNYGIILFNKGDENHLISSNPNYLEATFKNKTDIKTDIKTDGLVLVNPTNNNFTTDNLNYNNWKGINLKKGWNLISNISDKNISLSKLSGKIIWIYRNGQYFAYSNDKTLYKTILNKGFSTNQNILKPAESCWIYSLNKETIDLEFNKLILFNLNLQKGWNFVTPSATFFNLQFLTDKVIIWNYKNGEWSYFSNNIDVKLSYKKLNKILPAEGYFIYKK